MDVSFFLCHCLHDLHTCRCIMKYVADYKGFVLSLPDTQSRHQKKKAFKHVPIHGLNAFFLFSLSHEENPPHETVFKVSKSKSPC